jgi:molybdopterin-binding protein
VGLFWREIQACEPTTRRRVGGLMAEVAISNGGKQLTSMTTAHSARIMQLKPGQTAAALAKATEVMILRV